MSLYGKEKIWFLINRLLDEREVTSVGQPVALHPMNDLNNHYLSMEMRQLAEKLEKEKNAVKLIHMPTDQTYGKYLFQLLPDFDNYVAELRKDPKYLDWIGEKPEPEPTPKAEPISVNSARKNGMMTGKEKIQAVINAIDTEFQGLVKGNLVTLYSGSLTGLSLNDQKQVLDILTEDEKAIKYMSKNTYESQADIEPETQLDVMEAASFDGVSESQMFEELLASQTYSIEVLEPFHNLVSDKHPPAEEYPMQLFKLRLFYNRLIAILDTKVATGILVEDERLNYVYIHLTVFIDNILNEPTFVKLKEKAPEVYTTLMGNAEEIGEGWEYLRKDVLEFYGLIEREWILQGSPQFGIINQLQKTFDGIDASVKRHMKLTEKARQEFEAQSRNLSGRYHTQFGKLGKQQEGNEKTTENGVAKEQPKTSKVMFDPKTSTLLFGAKTCDIPDETLEHYICKFAFKNRKLAANEDDILEKSVKSRDSQRAVYDAMLRINKKTKAALGIEKLLFYKAAKIRISKEYQ